jgi:hypothetical protein
MSNKLSTSLETATNKLTSSVEDLNSSLGHITKTLIPRLETKVLELASSVNAQFTALASPSNLAAPERALRPPITWMMLTAPWTMLTVAMDWPPPERRRDLYQRLLPLLMFWAMTTATQNPMRMTAMPPLPHLITTVSTPCLLDILDRDSGALPWTLLPQPMATTWVKWHGWKCTDTIWSTPWSRH